MSGLDDSTTTLTELDGAANGVDAKGSAPPTPLQPTTSLREKDDDTLPEQSQDVALVPYSIFTQRQKWSIVILVSTAGLFS